MPAKTSLERAVWPPHPRDDETEEERLIRLEEERQAKKISDAIDQTLNAEKEQRKNAKVSAKVLLLGQAESGKSTVLKNFQLHFSPKAFLAETELWRPVIHLNLLRSINYILDLIDAKERENNASLRSNSSPIASPISDNIRRVRLSLTPLRQIEDFLSTRISGFVPESPVSSPEDSFSTPTISKRYHLSQVTVHSTGRGWKGKLGFKRNSLENEQTRAEKAEDVQNRHIIHACEDDMIALWESPEVKMLLKDEGVMLQDQPGFFLDDVKRVADFNFLPTSEDILRARVQTIGPEEHHIPIESLNPLVPEHGKEWIIYDVGGSRTQRQAWAQFFDDVTAIIFLAPISAFNQNLAEDPTINRLADSMKLWRKICSNKLLKGVNLVLFLNKMDILDLQLKSGIQFGTYVTSYDKWRTNQDDGVKEKPETIIVAKYLTEVFQSLHNQYTPQKRKIHIHWTCATDTIATSQVITRIQEVILVRTLAETNII